MLLDLTLNWRKRGGQLEREKAVEETRELGRTKCSKETKNKAGHGGARENVSDDSGDYTTRD